MNIRHATEGDDAGYHSEEVEFDGTPEEWFELCEKQPLFAEAGMARAVEAAVMKYREATDG